MVIFDKNNRQRHGRSLKRSGRIMLCIVLCLSMFLSPAVSVSASKVTDLQDKKNETQSKLNAANNKTDSLEGQQEALSEAMEAVNAEIVQTMAGIELLEERIADLDAKIEVKQQEYDEAKRDEENQYAAMKVRVKFMYERGDISYVQILNKASSFSDIINKAEYISKLYEYDRRLLVKFQETQKRVKEVQQELEEEKSEEEESKRGLEEEKETLETQIEELKEQYEDVDEQIAAAQAAAALLAQELREQNALVQEAMEEEARAAEEARRKAEEAAAALAATQAALNGGKLEGTEEKTVTEEETKEEDKEEPEEEDAEDEDNETEDEDNEDDDEDEEEAPKKNVLVNNSNGINGQDVVNYACQFVGNPYVFGGNSLTEGTDCSGFTMLVYKHFGYILGRTDSQQRNDGIAVDSITEALPGDIICYPGHVALYMGNGTVVHASTPATGIKYSPVTYRSWICIRRIIY